MILAASGLTDIVLPISVALVAAIIAPLLLTMINTRQAKVMRQEDWARQDLVAAKAALAADTLADATKQAADKAELAALTLKESTRDAADKAEKAAEDLAASQKEIADQAKVAAELLVSSNRNVAKEAADAAAETQGQLNVIHTLVNSNLTEQMILQLHAAQGQLASMHELIDWKKQAGVQPSDDTVASVKALTNQINDLESKLDKRAQATAIATSQIDALPDPAQMSTPDVPK